MPTQPFSPAVEPARVASCLVSMVLGAALPALVLTFLPQILGAVVRLAGG